MSRAALDDLARRVHRRLLAADDPGRGGPSPSGVRAAVLREAPLLGEADVADVVAGVLAAACGLGPLEPLLADEAVTEVMVNGDGRVWVERAGALAPSGDRLARPEVDALIERICAPLGVQADRRHPVVDARLADGSRVHAVVPPLAVDGPHLTIRRFRVRPVALHELAGSAVAELLAACVADRRNVLVSGGTGAGKTTLLNAVAGLLPASARVVTVEDTAELRLPGDHVVRLEARPASADGVGEVPLGDLVRAALRMRPDRIVVGEVRGPEALAMLQAMNTGHEGSLSTCHANGPADALRRVEAMVLAGGPGLPLAAVREHVRAALDVVVHVARLTGGRRRVVAVDEVEPGPGQDGTVATRPLARGDRVVADARRPARRPTDGGGESSC